ncbi:MAG TPA: transcription termination/antitermination NusG family protein [Pyrinomonadaceae bacterium]|nr:transcription termination/antitermination NusG family protein [Pyrinomonadaceae bacterium]
MMSNEVKFSGLRWYAIKTKPREEDRADSNLRAWSVETFAPKIKESRLNQFTNRRAFVSKPLFPGYIFARFNLITSLHGINSTRGIQRVVGFGDGPTPVDDQIIDMIRSRTNQEGLVELREDLVPGGELTIKDGPLRGLAGILEREMKDTERVMLLLTCVSYQGHFVIEREHLKLAS